MPLTSLPRTLLTGFASATVIAAVLTIPVGPAAADGCGAAPFSGGSGTAADPYLIGSVSDLTALAGDSACWGFDYRQTTDIRLTSPWTPIGTATSPFTGSYTGGDPESGEPFAISDLTFVGNPVGPVGLFGFLESVDDTVVISDLRLDGASLDVEARVATGALAGMAVGAIQISGIGVDVETITGGEVSTGGLIGFADGVEVTQVLVGGDFVIGGAEVGGVIGTAYNVELNQVGSSVTVESNGDHVGGVVGYGADITVTDSYGASVVRGVNGVGGVVGTSWGDSRFTSVYAAGPVSGTDSVGGILGRNAQGSPSATGSYWDLEATGQADSVVGLGRTMQQMQQLSNYDPGDPSAPWSIISGWQPGAATWGMCQPPSPAGYPFLMALTLTNPCLMAPSPPLQPQATAGDSSVTVSWLPPASTGSGPITGYRVSQLGDGRGCSASPTASSCVVKGLRNGTSYTFVVLAQSEAGWSEPSAWTTPVTPKISATIAITGTRGVDGDRGVVQVRGRTTNLAGSTVRAWVRLAGTKEFVRGSKRFVDDDGRFIWQRRTSERVHVYFTGAGVRSNPVTIGAR